MYNILTLNKIAAIGTSRLGSDYNVTDNCDAPGYRKSRCRHQQHPC